MDITTDNTESAALLAVRVRELEKQLDAADLMRDEILTHPLGMIYPQKGLLSAIVAYDLAKGTAGK